jgi:hypothetical protein
MPDRKYLKLRVLPPRRNDGFPTTVGFRLAQTDASSIETLPRRSYRFIAQLTTNGAKHLSLQKVLWRGTPDAYDSHGPMVLTRGRPANWPSSYWTVRTPPAKCQGAVSKWEDENVCGGE